MGVRVGGVMLFHSHTVTHTLRPSLQSVWSLLAHTPSAPLVAVKENGRVALIKGRAEQTRSSRRFTLSTVFLQVSTVQSGEKLSFCSFALLVSVSKLFHFPVPCC